VGWVSTWNAKCGIAGHLAHLVATVPAEEYVVFAARESITLGPDGANCVRSWTAGKEVNGLAEISRQLAPMSITALIIQFNYGFYNHAELNEFIEDAVGRGVCVIMHPHSTIDPQPSPNFQLGGLIKGLRKCARILAHSPSDMNRLKSLGLVENVMLLPHGVMRNTSEAAPLANRAKPLIASFGFSFANKGLVELVEAVALLRDEGFGVQLRMLNSQHPNSQSAEVVRAVRAAIDRLRLWNDVEYCTEYLEDDVCLRLLGEADLVVNPYQHTGESASGAVRYGLSVGRPVAVTPLPIFNDLGGAVFRLPGIAPAQIARGIADTLRHIADDSATAQKVREAARCWLDAHDAARQGERLMRLARTLAGRNPPARIAAGHRQKGDVRP
jgi:glycosyltransferase involved in cell wall biosynthesis